MDIENEFFDYGIENGFEDIKLPQRMLKFIVGFIEQDRAKQSILSEVSHRRELLTAFLRYGKQRHYTPLTEEHIEALANDFEGSL